MFSVGALQWLSQQRCSLSRAVRLHAALENISLFGGHHDTAAFGSDDGSNRVAGDLRYRLKLASNKARRAGFSANPERALLIALQCQNMRGRKAIDCHRLSSAPVELCQTCFRSKPHDAIRPLRNRMHAIRG